MVLFECKGVCEVCELKDIECPYKGKLDLEKSEGIPVSLYPEAEQQIKKRKNEIINELLTLEVLVDALYKEGLFNVVQGLISINREKKIDHSQIKEKIKGLIPDNISENIKDNPEDIINKKTIRLLSLVSDRVEQMINGECHNKDKCSKCWVKRVCVGVAFIK